MTASSTSMSEEGGKPFDGYSISEAAQIAAIYGYFVTQGTYGIFITRKRNGDSIALIRDGGEIVPYADDYNANDHLVAIAVAGGPANPIDALPLGEGHE